MILTEAGAPLRNVEARIRIERLLRGEIHNDDLTTVFSHLRARSAAYQTVVEIGDLLAHPDQRTRGIVTERVDTYFECLRFHYYLKRRGRLELNNAPPEFPRATKTALAHLDEKRLRRDVGMSRSQASRALKSALAKFERNADGTYSLQSDLDTRELDVIRFVSGAAVAVPAFDDARLMRETWLALRQNHLILDSERAAFAKLKPAIVLLAVARMHGTEIVFESGGSASLYAWCSQDADRDLQVFALLDHPSPPQPGQQIGLGVPMFLTTLKARDWCDEELLTVADGAVDWWDYPIELATDPLRLKRMA